MWDQSRSKPEPLTTHANCLQASCPFQAPVALICSELTVGELQHLVDDSGLVLCDPHVLQDLDHHLQQRQKPLIRKIHNENS